MTGAQAAPRVSGPAHGLLGIAGDIRFVHRGDQAGGGPVLLAGEASRLTIAGEPFA